MMPSSYALIRMIAIIFLMSLRPSRTTLFPYTTLFRSQHQGPSGHNAMDIVAMADPEVHRTSVRSEEHTSELQSHSDLVCRLLLEKKKKQHRFLMMLLRLSSRSAARSIASNVCF